MNEMPGWRKKPFWIRLLHWEYWSFNTVYIPIYPVFIFLCLRARSFFFYAAANPSIKNGGFLAESKKDIYPLVPADMQPKTIFFPAAANPEEVLLKLSRTGFEFPMIGKPDIGGRGRGVKKLENEKDIIHYVRESLLDFHIQEFISYENEAGIFYYRFPDQQQGNISGIVYKEFLRVKGDGKQHVRSLLEKNPRGILQLEQLEISEPEMLDRILNEGELFTVVPYGNHARGALFLDDSASTNKTLVEVVDALCRQIPGFYYGRLDIRYQSRDLLEQGKSFSVIEVNGAGSEPTHIYDPRHSIFFAWKEIIRHWFLLFKISRANHKQGHRYLTWKEGLEMFRQDNMVSKKLTEMNKKPA
jgi:hypothetical protein